LEQNPNAVDHRLETPLHKIAYFTIDQGQMQSPRRYRSPSPHLIVARYTRVDPKVKDERKKHKQENLINKMYINYPTNTLLQFGANVNAINRWGETPLHISCKVYSLSIILTLLKCHNVDVNMKE